MVDDYAGAGSRFCENWVDAIALLYVARKANKNSIDSLRDLHGRPGAFLVWSENAPSSYV